MDQELLKNYAEAVRARPFINRLPCGVREWSLQYEKIAFEDLRGQSGNPDITEKELLSMSSPSILNVISDLWPVIKPLAVIVLKKYIPTIAASGTIGAAIAAYLTK